MALLKHKPLNRGALHYKAKLSEEDVAEIKRIARENPGFRKSLAARKYGVTITTITFILTGETWVHIL